MSAPTTLPHRGLTGVTPRTATLEDESYLEYLQEVRNLAIRRMFPRLAGQLVQATARRGYDNAGQEAPMDEVLDAAAELPLSGTWKRVMRSQQALTWEKIQATHGAHRAQFEAELEHAETQRPDRLHYDADFEVPEYATYPIHLQPGGYVGDSLAGYVFHHGTRVFYQGDNDQDELHQQVVDTLAAPADGKIAKVLDVGCSIGQCTTLLKQAHPDAEIWGLDVGLPLLRYGHKRAVELDVDVHFKLGLAEALPFADGEFDCVLAYILFHEVPERLFQPIINEIHRVLRPGGTLTVVDAPNNTQLPAPNRLWQEFDARFNCEPYAPAFVASNLPGMLGTAGFSDINQFPTPTFLSGTTAVKSA